MKWKPRSKKRKPGRASVAEPRAQRQPLVRRDADGQVRLVLAPSSPGARETWRLDGSLFEQPWQDTLAESAANITVRTFSKVPTLGGAIDTTGQALAAFASMCDGWLSGDASQAVACQSGCSHCCHQPVSVTPVEAFTIVDHLRKTRTPEQLGELTQRLSARREQTQGLSRTEQYSPEFPCVFLEDGKCSIYEVRPLVCRGMNSLDAEACRERMYDAAARERFLREGGGLCYLEPIEGAHAMTAGLQLGLTDVYGLDMRVTALSDAVRLVLSDPTLPGRWIRGERLPYESV